MAQPARSTQYWPSTADRQRLGRMLHDFPDLRRYVHTNAGDILNRRPAYLRFLVSIAKRRGY